MIIKLLFIKLFFIIPKLVGPPFDGIPTLFFKDPTCSQIEQNNRSFIKYIETFEEGEPFSHQSRQFAGEHTFNIVPDPKSTNNKVARFELRDSDPQVKRSIRAEVGFRTVEKEAWYSYSIYFPNDGYEKDNMPEIISQWHQSKGGSPPNAVQIQNDRVFFRSINRSDTRDNSNKVYTNYPLGEVTRGKWQTFIFHFIHSPNADGLIEIWLNDKKLHTINGPNMRKEFDLPYFKFGIYKWRWNNREKTQTNRRVVLFDNIVIGNNVASLNDIISIGK